MFANALRDAQAHNWITLFRSAAELLCHHIHQTRAITGSFQERFIKQTLLDLEHDNSIVYAQYGFQGHWLENGKIVFTQYIVEHKIQVDLIVSVALPTVSRSTTVLTWFSDPVFYKYLVKELQEVVNRHIEHIWPRVFYLVKNPVQDNQGQIFDLLSLHREINMNELEMWTSYSDEDGYGIFHATTFIPATQTYRLDVSGDSILQ